MFPQLPAIQNQIGTAGKPGGTMPPEVQGRFDKMNQMGNRGRNPGGGPGFIGPPDYIGPGTKPPPMPMMGGPMQQMGGQGPYMGGDPMQAMQILQMLQRGGPLGSKPGPSLGMGQPRQSSPYAGMQGGNFGMGAGRPPFTY